MKKHPYRALMIWAVLAIFLVQIYPTVGWMTLSDDRDYLALSEEAKAEATPKEGTRQWRLLMWEREDDERAKTKPGYFSNIGQTVRRWAEFDRSRVINLGLDLQGGIHMVLGFDIEELPEERLKSFRDNNWSDDDITKEVQEIVLQQIRRRVNDFEAKEPVIQALGSNQIQIQLPGEKDINRAKRLITKTALLNFHIVAGNDETVQTFTKIRDAFPDEFTPLINRPALQGEAFTVNAENFTRVKEILEKAAQNPALLPEEKLILFSQPPKPYLPQIYELYVVDKTPIASGEGLQSSMAVPDNTNPPYWQILFQFNNAAGAAFGQATEANINRPMAIVLDGLVVSAPVIRDRITTNGQISGSFEAVEANDLAIALNSGSMVVPVKEEFTRVVGASLGADSVRKGVLSSITGISIVAVFMLIYYMSSGVIAVICLLANAICIIGAMAYFNMTLTLPGIAGLILTVGMAVDANVLIYERLREELKLGHTLLSSVENAFSRASVTILDANVTTLIAAAVLFQFGTGPIEGFAVTLSIGVCSTVFASLVICRALFDFALGRKLFKSLPMMSIIKKETKYPFLGFAKPAAAASILLILAGMAVFGYRGTDNFGVDFTEGTSMDVLLDTNTRVPVGDVRVALASGGFESAIVQESGAGVGTDRNEFIVRVRDIDQPAAPGAGEAASAAFVTVADRIREALAPLTEAQSSANVHIEDEQTVGPAVGRQLRIDAIKAVLASMVFILIYVAIRFELKFAAGAIVALFHDILVTLGIFAFLGRQIDMGVIAAILTIIGYSLNDTIVVFDRVREDLRLYRGKGHKFTDILNMAINSTLSRTILTSLTTLFVVIVLFFFGGDAINDFALALIIGIIAGTYSTVFIASPVAYAWQQIQGRQTQPTDTGGGAQTKGKKQGKKRAKGKGDDAQGATA